MLGQFSYSAPQSVSAALAALAATPGSKVLAGGQGLLTMMKLGRANPPLVVDLGRIAALRGVADADGRLRLGALTTLAELLDAPTVRDRYPALVEAARTTGDAQLRNRATVGGALASRSAAADIAPVLLLYGASLTIAGPGGEKTLPLTDFYAGPALAADEIITAVELPVAAPDGRGAYEKVYDRATLQPVCGVAADVSLAKNGTVQVARLAVTGATRRPTRLTAAERALAGAKVPVDTSALPIGDADAFVDDVVASAAYRAHLTRVLIGRAVARVVADRCVTSSTI